eukprot:COSAG01_NODE_17829_length_1121_cov_1.360078_1_plen_289_part_10
MLPAVAALHGRPVNHSTPPAALGVHVAAVSAVWPQSIAEAVAPAADLIAAAMQPHHPLAQGADGADGGGGIPTDGVKKEQEEAMVVVVPGADTEQYPLQAPGLAAAEAVLAALQRAGCAVLSHAAPSAVATAPTRLSAKKQQRTSSIPLDTASRLIRSSDDCQGARPGRCTLDPHDLVGCIFKDRGARRPNGSDRWTCAGGPRGSTRGKDADGRPVTRMYGMLELRLPGVTLRFHRYSVAGSEMKLYHVVQCGDVNVARVGNSMPSAAAQGKPKRLRTAKSPMTHSGDS